MITLRTMVLLGAGLSAAMSLSANAASISISDVTPHNYSGIPAGQVENFEGFGASFGSFDSSGGSGPGSRWATWDGRSTNVGTFDVIDGALAGSGSTCGSHDCVPELKLSDQDINGQSNITPDDGEWALQLNDTAGMVWNASLGGGRVFDRILFAIQDAADQRRTTVNIAIDGANPNAPAATTLTKLTNGNIQWVTISLAQAVSSATISIFNSDGRRNDSLTFDGAALYETPLPAAAWLFLSAIGGAGWLRRRKIRQ